MYKKKQILIFGTGGHCRSVIECIESNDVYEIIGIVDISKEVIFKTGEIVNGYPVVGALENLHSINTIWDECIIVVGDNYQRNLVYNKIIEQLPEAVFAVCIHSRAIVSKHAVIGYGTVIMAGAVVNRSSTIGKFALINSNATVEHDNKIEDFVTVAPGVTLGGTVSVGEHSVISIGSTVIHNISIDHDTVVGAHSLVNKNLPSNVVAYGIPARIIRKRTRGERYL